MMIKQTNRNEVGAALLETALMMLTFLILIFAIMEGGRVMQIQQTLNAAAREGSRYSVAPLTQTSTLPTSDQVTARVQTFLSAGAINNATVSVDQSYTTGGESTKYSRVVITVPYNVVTTSMFSMLEITLRGESVMRNETSP